MAQWLGVLAVLPENLGQFPAPLSEAYTANNFTSRGSHDLRPLWEHAHMIYTQHKPIYI